MERRQWIARWYDENLKHNEYRFDAPDNRVIARIDFKLRLLGQGKKIPPFFDLQEGREVVRVVPSLKELVECGELKGWEGDK